MVDGLPESLLLLIAADEWATKGAGHDPRIPEEVAQRWDFDSRRIHLETPSNLRDEVAERRRLIDVPALAIELGVTQRFVRRLVAEDRVPFLKIGKFVRFDPREIEEWVDECRRPPTAFLR